MQHSKRDLTQILEAWVAGQKPSRAVLSQLTESELADELRLKAFGIVPDRIEEVLEKRSQLFHTLYPKVLGFCTQKKFSRKADILETLWTLWLPLALQLSAYRQQQKHPFIQGILGGQGTGKSTLVAILKLILGHLGHKTLCLSLDDLYKTYSERLALTKQDSRLIWRGPPGTHDVQLGLTVLDRLRQADSFTAIEVPRFDKSANLGAGERTHPEVVQGIDLVLFEGWFVGVRPIDPTTFETAPPPIITEADRHFARDMNTLLETYLPLWERLDRLIVLYPVDYQLSLQWRAQAEEEAIAAGKAGMSHAEIQEFVKYFWKALHPELFIKPLICAPDGVDMVIEIQRDRSVGEVYRPSDR